MSKQIFRLTVPLVILTGLLEEICLITEKYYLVDYNAYKKFMYNAEKKDDFIRTIHEYYHLSKKHYIDQ